MENLEEEELCPENYHTFLVQKMCQIHINGLLNDIDLIVNDLRYPANKLMLVSACEYFEKNIKTNMNAKEIRLDYKENIDIEDLNLFFQMIHTGYIEDKSMKKIKEVVKLAILFKATALNSNLSYAIDNMKFDNFIISYDLMGQSNIDKDLLKKSIKFIEKNFSQIVACENFPKIRVNLLNEILQLENIVTSNEDQVFNAVKTWVNSDLSNRKKYFCKLLKHINLQNLSKNCCLNELFPMIDYCEGCTVLKNLLSWHMNMGNNTTNLLKPRMNQFLGQIIIIRKCNGNANHGVYHYDENKGNITLLMTVPKTVAKYHFDSLSKNIIVVENKKISTIDIVNKTFKNVLSLTEKCVIESSGVHRGNLYVFNSFNTLLIINLSNFSIKRSSTINNIYKIMTFASDSLYFLVISHNTRMQSVNEFDQLSFNVNRNIYSTSYRNKLYEYNYSTNTLEEKNDNCLNDFFNYTTVLMHDCLYLFPLPSQSVNRDYLVIVSDNQTRSIKRFNLNTAQMMVNVSCPNEGYTKIFSCGQKIIYFGYTDTWEYLTTTEKWEISNLKREHFIDAEFVCYS